jgi:hypothetical protein
MMNSCARASEIQQTLLAGRWPLAASAELSEHVRGCRSCAELVRVSVAFQQDRSAMVQAKQLDSPSLLWWRAQLRRRQAAMEKVSRPMWGAQVMAMVLAVCVAAGFLGWSLRDTSFEGALKTALTGVGLTPLLGVVALMALLLGGVAVYLTLERE